MPIFRNHCRGRAYPNPETRSYPAGSQRYLLQPIATGQQGQWDRFVSTHPSGHFLQSWGWGELKASMGWSPYRLVLWDQSQQQIVAAAQVLRRAAAHAPLWAGHLAYIPKGPVLDWSQPLLCQTFFSQLNARLRKGGALALRIELGQELCVAADDSMMQCVGSTQFYPAEAIQPVRTILLDLGPDEAILLARMKEKWRYNLRLAERKGVVIRVAQRVEDVHAWYALLQATSERDHFGIHTLDYYLRAWQIFYPRKQARLFLAEYAGQLLAGIFVGLLAHEAIYLYGASSNEHRNLMPNYLLQWTAIRWAKAEGATRYDFWGIPETDHPDEAMAGVSRFKMGWGGKAIRFAGCFEHAYHPLALHFARSFAKF